MRSERLWKEVRGRSREGPGVLHAAVLLGDLALALLADDDPRVARIGYLS